MITKNDTIVQFIGYSGTARLDGGAYVIHNQKSKRYRVDSVLFTLNKQFDTYKECVAHLKRYVIHLGYKNIQWKFYSKMPITGGE